ncbi:MAG: hypothetical protein ACRD96_07210, partial [Bryobacteraceae bacterium]
MRLRLAALALILPCAAQTVDSLFDPSVLHEIRLYLHPTDWKALRDNVLANTYYPAELEWRGQLAT